MQQNSLHSHTQRSIDFICCVDGQYNILVSLVIYLRTFFPLYYYKNWTAVVFFWLKCSLQMDPKFTY